MRRQNDAATFELTWPHDEFADRPARGGVDRRQLV